MPVSTQAQKNVQSSLDSVTGSTETGVSGLVFVAVDKNGDEIVASASGNRGLDTKKPMTMDTIFWIASCTKLLTAIACLQLVEQGKLKLDDHQHLYELCPELEKVQVLQEDGSLVPKEKEITLRMLLSHTAGFGYEFFNPKLLKHYRPAGIDVFSGTVKEYLKHPLVNQPGSRWEYGINIDWAGIYLERATGETLNDYMQKHIFAPLELKNISMLPSAAMKEQLASIHQRWPGSQQASERDHAYRAPLIAETDEEKKAVFNSGGAGCFAKPSEYVQILAAILNHGTHPKTKAQILKPETVKSMFENQIPEFPDFARQNIPAAKPEYTNPLPELYPQEGNPPQGWGLSFMLTIEPGATGRGGNTAFWAGIANCFYWVDMEKGIAGMIAAQVLPFGDGHVMGQWGACEAQVYESLK